MKVKPLVRRPLEAWHKTRTSEDQERTKLTFLDKTHSRLQATRELQAPHEPGELGEAPTLTSGGSWKPWLLLPTMSMSQ